MCIKKSLFAIFYFVLLVYSQNVSAKEHSFDCKLGYQGYPWMGDVSYDVKGTPVGYFEATYSVTNYLGIGARIAYGKYYRIDFSQVLEEDFEEDVILCPERKSMIPCNFVVKFSLLPLIIDKEDFFIDVYLNSHAGVIFFKDRNKFMDEKRPITDYGVYGGIALYPFEGLGIFYEHGYGNYIDWRCGLAFRF